TSSGTCTSNISSSFFFISFMIYASLLSLNPQAYRRNASAGSCPRAKAVTSPSTRESLAPTVERTGT
ncbi:hypothetical protein, partial [Desulfobacter sp. UBA2225]|uniref:hypothetical protein n=1 Tax=Desulfobacter sp. UBA2225 TaxID=1961413 RepID=UPI00257D9D4E